MRLTKFLNQVIVWGLVAALLILVITSLIVRDYGFIIHHPLPFIVELLFFSLIPSLFIIIVFVRTRHIPVKDSLNWLGVLTVKFAMFHILFQLSGVYTVLFTYPTPA